LPGWRYGGDGVLENGLHGLIITSQQNHVLIKGFNAADQFDAVHQEDGDGSVFFAQGVQEYILKILSFVHNYLSLVEPMGITNSES
jgi:hypothetical protein